MNLEEMKELAGTIIEDGYANDQTDDDIKMEMFTQKIPYSKLNSLFKSVAIELGLLVDPKVVTDGINEKVENVEWDEYAEWSALEPVLQSISDNVDGATTARVLTLVRAFCKEEEIDLPSKPRASSGGGGRKSGGGKIAEAIVAVVNSNPEATKQDAYDALGDTVGGNNKHVNILYYVNLYFAMCLAAKNGTTVEEESTKIRAQADPIDDSAVEVEDDEEMEEAA